MIETRLLEGPSVYRLEPVVKLELAVGRRRTWYGQRAPGAHALVHLGADVPMREWPDGLVSVVEWVRRLRADHGEGHRGLAVHRSSDPGHWIVTFPWVGAERSREIVDAALALAEQNVSPARRARLTGGQSRLLARWGARIDEARTTPASWIRDTDRRMPIVSISGTNGKSTVTRLLSHVLLLSGRHVGTTTSDGVLVDERMIDPGDWTGPGGAHQILVRSDVDVAVLETARGGIVLRGVGYESNDASILTNISSDHLDLQGIHTLPELAEVKATICRITRPDGWVILNGDDPLVTAVARRVRARIAFFSMSAVPPPTVRRHLAPGRPGLPRPSGSPRRGRRRPGGHDRPGGRGPDHDGGIARHNVANALAAAAGARALGASIDAVAHGLRDFRPTTDRSPGRLNLFRLGQRIVIVDFAHNEAGISAVLDVAEGIAGERRGGPRRSRSSSGRPATDPTTPSAGSAGSPGSGPSGSPSRRRTSTSAAGPGNR